MAKRGLLRKAKSLLSEDPDGIAGISDDDRREILERINEISKKNRIDVGASRFAFKAKKRGVLFPLLVNLLAVAVTAGALYALSLAFREREAQARSSGSALASAEGTLIRELKRDAESRLSAKDKEIADMQTKLASLDAERTKLQTSFEDRVAERERTLREQLRAELEKERERLTALGLTEETIAARLKKFEEEKTAAFRKELAAFQSRIAAERAAADANFARLREEYSASVSSLNEERKRIQDESRRREDELRATLEAKTRAAETETLKATAGLEQAREELARAEETRKKAQAAEERIVGLYLSVRNAVRERRFEDAATSAAALNAYLADPASGSSPETQGRKQADLFAVEAFAYMARTELERAGSDTSLLLRQAELISAVRASVADARTAQKAGNEQGAAKAYQEALGRIPEILSAHEYFLLRAQDEAAKRAELSARAASRAADAAAAGDYDTAAAAYAEAIDLYAVDRAVGTSLVEGVARLGTVRADKRKIESDTRAARAPMERGKAALESGRWQEALAAYGQALSRYPAAEQSPRALEGIAEAFAALDRQAAEKARRDELRIAELEQSTADLGSRITLETTEKDAEIARLNALLEQTRQESALAAEQAAQRQQSADALAATDAPAADLARLREENSRLAEAASRYDSLVAAYGAFREQEDAARAVGDASSLVEARSRFDSFLEAEQTKRTFPDLRDRIVRYEKEFTAAGQRESIFVAKTFAETALGMRDAAARDRYLSDLASRYREDPEMASYIETLRKGLQ
jgi:hypothetical protein